MALRRPVGHEVTWPLCARAVLSCTRKHLPRRPLEADSKLLSAMHSSSSRAVLDRWGGQAGVQGVQNVQQWPPVLGARGGCGCGWQETPWRGGLGKVRLRSGFCHETQHILREMCLGTGVRRSWSCVKSRCAVNPG